MAQGIAFLNRLQNRVPAIVAVRGEPPWIERLVENEQVMATLICSAPGSSSRRHYHENHDEFWVVMGGELIWEVAGEDPLLAMNGDLIVVPKGKAHNIKTVGAGPSLRLAVVVPDVPHIDAETGEVFE